MCAVDFSSSPLLPPVRTNLIFIWWIHTHTMCVRKQRICPFASSPACLTTLLIRIYEFRRHLLLKHFRIYRFFGNSVCFCVFFLLWSIPSDIMCVLCAVCHVGTVSWRVPHLIDCHRTCRQKGKTKQNEMNGRKKLNVIDFVFDVNVLKCLV